MPEVVDTSAQGSAANIEKILIVGPSWLGDMVMAQSLFILLKKFYENAYVAVLAPNWCADILARMPQVDEAIMMPVGHGKLNLKVRWQLAQNIKARQFDLAIIIPGSLKSALIPWFARIPLRRGFIGEQRYGLLNDMRQKTPELPLNVQHYASLAYDEGENWVTLAQNPPQPSLFLDAPQQQRALDDLGLNLERPAIVLCPGAEYGPAKRWPEQHYASVASTMIEQGFQIWILGSAKDQLIADKIAALVNHEALRVLAGRTKIAQAVDIMALAKVVITNDSGLMHVAAAVGVPVVAIYGSSSADFTPPLTEKSTCVSLNLSCSPCFKRECPLEHTNCLNQLKPDYILNATKAYI